MENKTPKYPESFTLKLRKGSGEEFDARVKQSGKTRNGFLNSLIFDRKHNSSEIKGILANILTQQTKILKNQETILESDNDQNEDERKFIKDLSLEVRTAIFEIARGRR